MKEVFHFTPDDYSAHETVEPPERAEPQISIGDGAYRDPVPSVVEWINNKYQDPDENIKASLIKAFEWAGVVKTVKEINGLAKPLEHSGVLPPTTDGAEPPEFEVNAEQTSEFTDRRDVELLLEFREGDEARNLLLEKIKNATAERRLFGEKEEDELVHFIQSFRRESPEFTPVFRILRVMTGIMEPEDPKNVLKSDAPSETRILAPDIYFMLLKDEREAAARNAQAVA